MKYFYGNYVKEVEVRGKGMYKRYVVGKMFVVNVNGREDHLEDRCID
jgi:hypothetical protein